MFEQPSETGLTGGLPRPAVAQVGTFVSENGASY